MMKKLAKAALLAAATAFLLAGFPACSSDDDDDVYITNPDDSDADKDSEGDKTEDEGDQGDKDDESEGDKSDEEGDGEEEGSGEEDGDGEGEDDKEDDSDDDNKEDDSDDNEGEETPDAFESWELDFTSDELKPASNSSLTAGQVIGNVLTVDAPGSGNLNASGYIKVGNGGILSFDVKADATFTFTFANSNKDRTVTLKTDSTQVGDAITVDKAEHSVSLKKGLCTIEFAGGDIQISKMSLTYAN